MDSEDELKTLDGNKGDKSIDHIQSVVRFSKKIELKRLSYGMVYASNMETNAVIFVLWMLDIISLMQVCIESVNILWNFNYIFALRLLK